ncbi:peptide chain release factor 2 [Thermopirellula anaerolimosa]
MEGETLNRAEAIRERLTQLRDSLDYAGKKAREAEIESIMAGPDFWNDQEKSGAILSELKAIRAIVKPVDEAFRQLDDIDAMIQLADEDPAFGEEVPAALENLEALIEDLEIKSLLSGEHDACNALLTINARDGGTDAHDWAAMLLRMYIQWAESRGYEVELLDRQDGEIAGINSATVAIRGPMAYGYLKGETGIHRLVRISPFNAEGKRQTSFAAVDVTPEITNDNEIVIRDEDIEEQAIRASGPGGQHVNKTSSAIRLLHIPTGIMIKCQSERSQHQNRAMAMKMLRAQLARLEEIKREEALAAKYESMPKTGFGSQIRSYFQHPDQRIKDARTGYSLNNFQAVMDGEIQGFLDAYLRWRVSQEAAAKEKARAAGKA